MTTTDAQVTLISSIAGLADVIETHILDSIRAASNGAAKMIFEDMLLVGPTDKTHRDMIKAAFKRKGVHYKDEDILRAALLIREKSLKARGL